MVSKTASQYNKNSDRLDAASLSMEDAWGAGLLEGPSAERAAAMKDDRLARTDWHRESPFTYGEPN